MQILPAIEEIFCDFFDDDSLEISLETSADDIDEWDSVAQVQLTIMVEEFFNVEFTTDEMASIKTVGDIVRYVEAHKG